MNTKKFQLRTTYGSTLFGYRAKKDGKRCIAVMKLKGNETSKEWVCLGYIYPEQLSEMVRSGPYLNLDSEEINMC